MFADTYTVLQSCIKLDVNNVNGFIEEDPELQGLSLYKLIKKTDGTIFNNVGQVWRGLTTTSSGVV